MAESLKSYLVSLGFKVDETSGRKFAGAVDTATKRVLGLGAAVEGAALAVEIATTKMGRNLEALYWMSKRTGESAENIGAFSYAVSQLGGSADAARASLKNVANFLQYNPGGANFLRSLGVDSARVAAGDLDQLSEKLRAFWESGPAGRTRAKSIADFIGIDESTFRSMIDGDLQKYEERYRQILKRFGLSQQDAVEQGKQFMQMWRDLGLEFEIVSTKVGTALMPQLERLGTSIEQYFSDPANVEKFTAEVKHVVEGLADVVDISVKVGEVVLDMIGWFERADKATDGWSTRLTAAVLALRALGLLGPAVGAIGGAAGGAGAASKLGRAAGPLGWLALGYGALSEDWQGAIAAGVMSIGSDEARHAMREQRKFDQGEKLEQKRNVLAELEVKHHLPRGLLDATWDAESSRAPGGGYVRSPKGALGPFQFMPKTAEEYGLTTSSAQDFEPSADAAARKYEHLLGYYHGDLRSAVAAYNFGEGNLARTGIGGVPAETQAYLDHVIGGHHLGDVGSSSVSGDVNVTTNVTQHINGAGDSQAAADASVRGFSRATESATNNLRARNM